MIPVYIYKTHIILLKFYLMYLHIIIYVYNNIHVPSKKQNNSSVIYLNSVEIKEDLVIKNCIPNHTYRLTQLGLTVESKQ